jgi:hypothetical protein
MMCRKSKPLTYQVMEASIREGVRGVQKNTDGSDGFRFEYLAPSNARHLPDAAALMATHETAHLPLTAIFSLCRNIKAQARENGAKGAKVAEAVAEAIASRTLEELLALPAAKRSARTGSNKATAPNAWKAAEVVAYIETAADDLAEWLSAQSVETLEVTSSFADALDRLQRIIERIESGAKVHETA